MSGSMPAALAAWRVWSIRSPGVLDCGPEIALGGLTGAGGAGVVGETASVGGGVCAGCVVLGLSSLSICSCAQFWPACVMSLEGVGACGTGACGAPGIVPMAGVGVTGGAGCTATGAGTGVGVGAGCATGGGEGGAAGCGAAGAETAGTMLCN